MRGNVGAGIVEIITESLYDKPIVIFREYVQNSVDSITKANHDNMTADLSIRIWKEQDTLYFLDNGTGIPRKNFAEKMGRIAGSDKTRRENIGYKGIGRLSGISYCGRLRFINILDYSQDMFQTYTIDCEKYAQMRKGDSLNNLDFPELMEQIATMDDQPEIAEISELLNRHRDMFREQKTGFLVILENITKVLSLVLNDANFQEELRWLLPVPFQDELLSAKEGDESELHLLFHSLGSEVAFPNVPYVAADSFQITYNGTLLYRPIGRDMLREFTCRVDLEQYAVCVHNFSNSNIVINRKNPFSGIRLYLDNILLCDETEIIPALQQFGMLPHPVNETIQTVRGIGAIIYIVDKVALSANARRTFIDVTDDDSFRFLQLIGEFVEDVYQARYALSNYNSARKKQEATRENLEILGDKARNALIRLARQKIDLEDEPIDQRDFSELSLPEKKRLVKSKISKDLSQRVKRYVEQTTEFQLDSCLEDFITWLNANR
ncbi:ATP-binding protein [Oscillospiraceae bacterium 50-60]|jgi:molecular chaperone HtpG